MIFNETTGDHSYVRYDSYLEFFIEKQKFHGKASDVINLCARYNGGKLAVFDSNEKRTFLRNKLFKTGKIDVISRPKHVERKIVRITEHCGG